LTSDESPRNNVYRVPLTNAADEELANSMADAIWSAVLEEHDAEDDFDSDRALQQCLVDARRMLREPEYARLFGGDGLGSLDEIVETRARWRKP